MSCPQIWNIEQEKDREKERVGGRPAKLNMEEGDRDLERRRVFALLLCPLCTRNCGFYLQHRIIQIIEGAFKILI